MFFISHIVEPSDLSPEYQHLHHAQALYLLEKARLAFLESLGASNSLLQSQGYFLVIASMQLRYSREILAERLQITCEEPQILSRIIRVQQRILREDGTLCVGAQVDSLCMQGSTRRAVRPPELLCERFRSHSTQTPSNER
jgi:acyl-CoA thioesterase FadM